MTSSNITNISFEDGQTYIINHTRKGTFGMRVDSQDEVWLHGEVVSGTAQAMMDYNVKEKGEKITVRKCFIRKARVV